MKFDPELWLRIRDKRVTAQQIRILSELARTHSQTLAAEALGISVPVLHRHLKSLINKLGLDLVITTPNGTWLTDDGRRLLKIYNRYQEMLAPGQGVKLYCTPITLSLLESTITEFEVAGGKYHISINDDLQNLRALYLGRADLVIFDDPVYAMEFEGFKEDKILTRDIFNDTLVHVKKGKEYIRYKYGAQRLGFRYLEAEGIEYKVLHEVSDIDYLINSGMSYFINKSLVTSTLTSKQLDVPSAGDPAIFTHPVMAVSINPTEDIKKISSALRENAKARLNVVE